VCEVVPRSDDVVSAAAAVAAAAVVAVVVVVVVAMVLLIDTQTDRHRPNSVVQLTRYHVAAK